MDYLTIFSKIFSLFLIILVGYVVKKRGIVARSFRKDLAELIFYVTLPALIIGSMQLNASSYNSLGQLVYIILLSILGYIVAIFFAFLFPKIFRMKGKNKGVYQFILTFANVGFMGYPVVTTLFGPENLFYAIIFVMPFNILVFTLGVYYMSKGGNDHKINPKLFLNPGALAVLFALLLNSLDLMLPHTVLSTTHMIGDLTTPLSMLMVGITLADTKILNAFTNIKLYLIAIFRLFIFPIIIYFIYSRFNIDLNILKVGVILAAMPAAANTVIVAEKYDANSSLASQAVVLTTALSMASIPIIALFLLQL